MDVTRPSHVLQSSPTRGAECDWEPAALTAKKYLFQSSPNPRAECDSGYSTLSKIIKRKHCFCESRNPFPEREPDLEGTPCNPRCACPAAPGGNVSERRVCSPQRDQPGNGHRVHGAGCLP